MIVEGLEEVQHRQPRAEVDRLPEEARERSPWTGNRPMGGESLFESSSRR
jgi:hypothetical protein